MNRKPITSHEQIFELTYQCYQDGHFDLATTIDMMGKFQNCDESFRQAGIQNMKERFPKFYNKVIYGQ